MKLSALLAGSLLCVFSVSAQESPEVSRGPDGGTRVHVGGIEILLTAGNPFSGRDSIDWTRHLEDGTLQTVHLDAKLARDNQGRVYRERRSFVPANAGVPAGQESKLKDIIILDPVARTRTSCNVAARHCDVTRYRRPSAFRPPPDGSFDAGARYLTRESLGTDVIDGLSVVGTRETVTVNAGVVGNSQPLVSTKEFWYSADLGINLAVTRKDPREGTQVIHVVDLSRTEPDPTMFQVPAGYAVQDHRLASRESEN
jgi:hypothetical protein